MAPEDVYLREEGRRNFWKKMKEKEEGEVEGEGESEREEGGERKGLWICKLCSQILPAR